MDLRALLVFSFHAGVWAASGNASAPAAHQSEKAPSWSSILGQSPGPVRGSPSDFTVEGPLDCSAAEPGAPAPSVRHSQYACCCWWWNNVPDAEKTCQNCGNCVAPPETTHEQCYGGGACSKWCPLGDISAKVAVKAIIEKLPEPVRDASGFPFTTNTKKLSRDIPDTTIPGAGYVADCDASKCAGADKNYYIQAILRDIPIKNSKKIKSPKISGYNNYGTTSAVSEKDVIFTTRHLEAIPGAPNSEFGPTAFGGDGTHGILGPALWMLPGQSVSLFVKNMIDPAYQKTPGAFVPTKESYAQKVNNVSETGSKIISTSLGSQNVVVVKPNGTWKVTASEMDVTNRENQPGFTTDHGFNMFNIHLHGMEVAPHLFHPMGTSDPKADWITIEPTNSSGRQCYCYKFSVAPTNSKGLYAWHTHRHGTSAMSTFSGMFGALLTDNYILPSQTPTAALPATLHPATNPASSEMYDLVQMAYTLGIPFNDSDVFPFIVQNPAWKYVGAKFNQMNPSEGQKFAEPQSEEARHVEVNGFIQNEIPTTQINPFLVNQEYQPTFKATACSLSMFRFLCLSTNLVCGFEVQNSKGKAQPFYVVASDGITFRQAQYYPANDLSPKRSKIEKAAEVATVGHKKAHEKVENTEAIIDCMEPQTQAYLQLGGGMRQDVLIQFTEEGNFTIVQYGYPGIEPQQVLATVNVHANASMSCKAANLSKYTFNAAKDTTSILQRKTDRHLGIDFEQQLNRSQIPFVKWGMADYYGSAFQAFNRSQVNMEAHGGSCAQWKIRSKDAEFHPFHIHVNPFLVTDLQMAPASDKLAHRASTLFKHLTATAFYSKQLIGTWRDTVMVPPMGEVTIKQCYDAGPSVDDIGTQISRFAGKFVFHCHFLTHEDTGLIHNVMLTKGDALIRQRVPPLLQGSAVVPAEVSECPTSDPCGIGRAQGCAVCPVDFFQQACSCISPEGAPPPATMGKSADSGFPAPPPAVGSEYRLPLAMTCGVAAAVAAAFLGVALAVHRLKAKSGAAARGGATQPAGRDEDEEAAAAIE